MLLSVLIPTHNYKCYTLVADLQVQLEHSGVAYEIIVAEDGSKDQVSIISNHRIDDLPHCRHIIRRENVGRAAIRNFLADEALGEWLLFMDSDGRVVNEDFIPKYLQAANDKTDVVLGGWTQPAQCPEPDKMLRWKYEQRYLDHLDLSKAHFRSFCFMVRRDVFMQVRFPEAFTAYGWEDNHFGISLQRIGCRFTYIDNPLMNVDLETNRAFLLKTEEAMRTLARFRNELGSNIKLLQTAQHIETAHLVWLCKACFAIVRPLLRRNLLSNNPSLRLFAAYKLGYFLCLPTAVASTQPQQP